MNAITARTRVAAILLTVPLFVSGCICRPDCWWGRHPQPRQATLHVYVYDYYTYNPVSWAVVELCEEDGWSWDHVGTWPVNSVGHAMVRDGYLYHDGCCGSDDREFLVEVGAHGYHFESIEIELDYWHPSETLYFYLVPWYCCDGRPAPDDQGEPPELPIDQRPPDRVMVGSPKEGAPEGG